MNFKLLKKYSKFKKWYHFLNQGLILYYRLLLLLTNKYHKQKYIKNRYMSPEMIIKEGHNFSVDFYGLGAFLYEMVFGIPPFY